MDKPKTRYGLYAQKSLEDLETKWLETNDPICSSTKGNFSEQMYFESAQDKEYRYNLAKEGKLPSWYWYHKRLSIVKFIKDVSCILE